MLFSVLPCGCEVLAGIDERGVCEPPKVGCAANTPFSCGSQGHAWIVDAPCGGSTPVCVAATCRAVAQISAGDSHTCALLTNGAVFCWGDHGEGRLGAGSDRDVLNPSQAPDLAGVAAIALGEKHTCALVEAPEDHLAVKCWGRNNEHQTVVSSDQPSSDVPAVAAPIHAKAITLGDSHSCVRSEDDEAMCWGDNTFGQLGTGEDPAPATVSAAVGSVKQLSAGGNHTCAVLYDRTVVCWGQNASGQLGDGTRDKRVTPVQVKDLQNVEAIALGRNHTCVLAGVNRKVSCWGANDFGQLGRTDLDDSPVPIEIGDLQGVKVLAAGSGHTCALVAGPPESVVCWGNNHDKQLGGAAGAQGSLATLALGNDPVEELALGGRHTCLRLQSGTVECWGANDKGQLGDGTTTPKSLPSNPVDW